MRSAGGKRWTNSAGYGSCSCPCPCPCIGPGTDPGTASDKPACCCMAAYAVSRWRLRRADRASNSARFFSAPITHRRLLSQDISARPASAAANNTACNRSSASCARLDSPRDVRSNLTYSCLSKPLPVLSLGSYKATSRRGNHQVDCVFNSLRPAGRAYAVRL